MAILGLMLLMLAAAGYIIASKPTRLGLDLRGGTELIYEGRPTPKVPQVTSEAINDAIETIRKRADALGVSEPEIQQAGAEQISVSLPDVQNAQRAKDQVGTTAQLQFYDWEPNVLGKRGPDAPYSGSQALYRAAIVASEAKPKAEATDIPPGGASAEIERRFGGDQKKIQAYYDKRNDTSTTKYYVFGPDKRPLGDNGKPLKPGAVYQPASSCRELLAEYEPRGGQPKQYANDTACAKELKALEGGGPPAGSRVIRVPQGVVIVQAERAPNQPDTVERYFVIEDDSELSGSDIKNPEQNFDQRTNEPIVTMDFTDNGRQAFASATKREAERGSRILLPPGTPKEQAFQRFAITLDNRIVSLATIDFVENPEGIDGRTGAQINGIGSIQETQDLAQNLRIGALPIELKLISQTQVSAIARKAGASPGPRGGRGGLGPDDPLPARLLPRARRGGHAGAPLLRGPAVRAGQADPDHADPARHRRNGAHARRRRRREHRHVRTHQGGGARRADRSLPRSPAATPRRYGRSSTPTSSRSASPSSCSRSPPRASRASRSRSASERSSRCSRRCSPPRRSSARWRARRLLRRPSALGAGKEGGGWNFDFMGKSKWFFSISGAILADRRGGDRRLGINFGIDFESGTRIIAPLERAASVEQVREDLQPLGYDDAKVQEVDDPELGDERRADLHRDAAAAGGEQGRAGTRPGLRSPQRRLLRQLDRADVRRADRAHGGDRGDRLADPDLDLHRDAVRDQVRGAGADRARARPPDHGAASTPRREGS